jgi:hypothetical protein
MDTSKEVIVNFRYHNPNQPLFRKFGNFSTRGVSAKVGCGGPKACRIQISGYFNGNREKTTKLLTINLKDRQRRIISLLAGAENAKYRTIIKKRTKRGLKSRFTFIAIDLATNRAQIIKINRVAKS